MWRRWSSWMPTTQTSASSSGARQREKYKARALRDAGFDMDLDGDDIHSIQYQNANNSVRATDSFMEAVVNDELSGLRLGPFGWRSDRTRCAPAPCSARLR